ncbi:MAG TPA: HAMP domain-containing protein, partial [Magnetococcales bacterium]|nr:HAMP domain-containing protein [Magnetococcales bacterium]
MMPLIIRSSLRNKMAMAFLLVGLVPLIFGAWMGGRVIEKTLIEQAGEQLNSILAMKSAQLNDFFADRREEMDFAIHDPDVREAVGRFSQIFSEHPDAVHQSEWVKASNELGGWFERYLSLNHYYDILLLDAQGNVVFSVRRESDLGQNVVHGPLSQSPLGKVFQRGRQGVVIQDFEPYIPSDSKSFVFTAGPVFAGNNLNGIMVAQISRERLNAIMVFNHGLGETGETYLVGRVDSVIGYRNDRLGKGITSDREVADYFHVLQALDGKGDMEVGVNQDGSQDLKVYSPVVFPDLNWAIVATRSLQEVLAPKQQLLNIFLLEVLATALVVLVASWGVVLLFYRPIVHLTHVSERLQAGEWSARAEWPSQDELGRMARAFNRMAQQFETSLWIKSQSASLAEVLQSAKTMELFAEVLLSTLLPLIKGEHGRLYSLNRYTGRYELVGPMRFFQQDEQSMGFALGEGLIGLVAKEKKVRTIEVADGGQVRLRGGLADIVPLHLYLQPIVMEGETLAVLEFVSQTPFGIPGLGLLQEISTLIALTLDNLRAKVDLEHMLDQSQRFRTELEAQAQEVNLQKRLLEQNNDELTQQSLELERQQEVVNANNTQLEQKNRELELQTEELTRTRHHAEKISQYKTDFLANMSHELRTPLNSLLILARELEENRAGNLTEDQLQSARIIHASGGELLQLINGILDLSKIESGGLHWMVEKIDLEIFSKDIETRFQGEAR